MKYIWTGTDSHLEGIVRYLAPVENDRVSSGRAEHQGTYGAIKQAEEPNVAVGLDYERAQAQGVVTAHVRFDVFDTVTLYHDITQPGQPNKRHLEEVVCYDDDLSQSWEFDLLSCLNYSEVRASQEHPAACEVPLYADPLQTRAANVVQDQLVTTHASKQEISQERVLQEEAAEASWVQHRAAANLSGGEAASTDGQRPEDTAAIHLQGSKLPSVDLQVFVGFQSTVDTEVPQGRGTDADEEDRP